MTPSLAGPKRPQDRIEIGNVKAQFTSLFSKPTSENGFNLPAAKLHQRYELPDTSTQRQGTAPDPLPGAPRQVMEMKANRPLMKPVMGPEVHSISIGNGDVLIAAITSCTNTSNPGVLLAAGLLAKKAVERGLKVKPHIKTSLAPGSRIVTEYLTKTGLLPYLEKLGFYVAAYGCTTCIGNAGDLSPEINETIIKNDLSAQPCCRATATSRRASTPTSRPTSSPRRRWWWPTRSPARCMKDLMTEPLGKGKNGEDVWIGDIWPASDEVYALMKYAMDAKAFAANYGKVKKDPGELWKKVQGVDGQIYNWPKSTYIAEPPFFDGFSMPPGAMPTIANARALGIFGDSITTDHISPAGSIKDTSPAGK